MKRIYTTPHIRLFFFRFFLIGFGLGLFTAGTTYGQLLNRETIVEWDFNNQTTNPSGGTLAGSAGQLTTQGGAGTITFGTSTPDGTGFSARANGWAGGMNAKFWQVQFSAQGYRSIQVSSKQQSDSGGPREFKLQYRIGSLGAWTEIGVPDTQIDLANNWTTGVISEVELPTETDEESSIFIRWIMRSNVAIGPAISNNSDSRIDDIIITGAPVSSEIELTGNPIIAGNITNPLDHFLYRVDLDVSENDAVLDELRFVNNSFNEADIAVFKLWRSDLSNGLLTEIASFNPNTDDQDIVFSSLNEDLEEGETYYYAITVDIDPSAGYNNTLTLGTPEVGFSTNANVSSGHDPDPIPAGTTQTILIQSEVSLASFSASGSPDNLLISPTDNRVYRLDISAAVVDAMVEGISFPLNGTFTQSDISSFKLAYSTNPGEIPGTILQTIPNTDIGFGGTVSFSGFTQRVNANETGYFSLLVDIPPGAENGNTIGVGSVGAPQLSFAHPILETTGWPQAAGNPQEIALASDITVNSFSPADLAPRQNSLNNLLYRIDLSVANSNNVLNSLALTTTGSYQVTDIVRFSLWTGPDASGPATRIKDIVPVPSGGTLTFDAFGTPPALTAGTPLFLYVTVDFTAGAVSGRTIGITATTPPATAFGFGDLSTVSGTLAASTLQTIAAAPGVVLSGNSPEGTNAITQLTNNRIYRIVMDVTAANATVTEIRLPTQGSYQIPDIAEFSLWYSTDIGIPGTQIATSSSIVAPGGTLTFAGLSQEVAVGTGYFSVMVDVRSDAVYGRTIGINQPNLTGIDFEGVVFESGSFTTGSNRPINVPTEVTFSSFSNESPNNILNQPTGNRVFRLDLSVDNFNAELTALTLKTTGTYNATDIAGFYLHYSTDPNEIGAQIPGSLTAPASGGNLVFSGLAQVFPAGETGYLWLTADISPSATGDRTLGIDAIAEGDVTLANSSNKIGLPTPASNEQVISVPVDVSVAVFSPLSDQILQGAINQLLYRYDLSLGATSDARLSEISMITQGDYDITDIVNFKLWYAANDAGPDALLATVTTIPESGQPLTFTGFNRLFTAGQTGYLYVTADVAVAAFPGNTMGIAGTATAGDLTFLDVVNINPIGFPTAAGNNQTIEASSKITVITSSPPPGDISVLLDNEIYSIELSAADGPATLTTLRLPTHGSYVSGDVVRFQLLKFNDVSEQYEAIAQVNGTVSGQTLVFDVEAENIVLVAGGDPVLFKVTADISSSANYGNTLGIDELPLSNIEFAIPVMYNGGDPQTAGNLQTIAIESVVTLSSVAPTEDLTSPTNNRIYRLIAEVETFDAIINSITFTTSTSSSFIAGDISNFKLFYSTDEAAEGVLIATLPGNSITSGNNVVFNTFTGFDGRIEADSTAYFWLMVDISPTASNTRDIGVASTTVDFAFPIDLTDDTSAGNDLIMDVPSEIVVSFSSAPEGGVIQQNTTNNLLYKVHISVTNSDALLQELTVPFYGGSGTEYAVTDIGDVTLWYSLDSTALGSIVETTTAVLPGNPIVFEGINQNITAGTTAYYSITVDVPATATSGNTIGINPISIDADNFQESANIVSGSPTGTGNLQTIALSPKIAIANTLTFPSGDIVVPPLNPIYTFDLAVTDANALLNSLQFTTSSNYVPADIASIALYYSDNVPGDMGTEIASTTTIPAPGGSILFEGLNLTLPAGNTGYFTIVVNVTSSAVIGNNISIVGIPNANIGLADPKIITTTGPLTNGNARAFNIPSIIDFNSFSPAADTITTPINNKLIRLDLDVSQFDALLNGLTLTTKGDFEATDVARFKLWLSADGDELSEELAVFENPIVAGGDIIFSGIGSERLSAGGTRYLWVTVDIAPTSMRLNEIGIDEIAVAAAFSFAHPVTFTNTFPIDGSELQVIDVFSGITVSTFEPPAANLRQTAKDQLIYRIDLAVADSDTRLNALTLATDGTFTATDIDRFALWFSADENDPGIEPIAIFDGPIAGEDPLTFTGLDQTIPAASTGYLFITVDIAEEAEPGNTLSVALADIEDLEFSPSVNVFDEGIVPGNPFTIVAAPVIAIDFISPPENGEIKQLENNLLYTLSMAVSSADVEISELQLPTKGEYDVSDFSGFKLWYSEDDEDLLNAELITDLAPVATGEILVFSGLNQSIAVGTTGYFSITVDVETSAVFGNSIGIDAVPYSGLGFVGEVILTDEGPAGAGNDQTIAIESNVFITGVSPPIDGVLSSPTNNVIYRIDLSTTDFDALLESLTVTTSGSYTAADIIGFELWYSDTDAALGDVIAIAAPAGNGSQIVFDLSSQPERFSAGSTGYLWITVDIAFSSEGGPTIGIEGIPLENFGFLHLVNLDGADPTEEGEEQIIDVPSDILVTGISAPEGNVNQNAVNQVLYTLQLDVDDSDARLQSLNLPLIGSLEEGDVTAFKLWFSATGFNLETELGATADIDGDSISFAFNQVIPAETSGYFTITADIAFDAEVGNTLGIDAVEAKAFIFDESAILTGVPTLEGNLKTIVASSVIAISGFSEAGPITQTQSNLLYRIDMEVTVVDARLTALQLPMTGNFTAADVSAFRLWYSPSLEEDSILVTSAASIVGGGETLTFTFDQLIEAGDSAYFFIFADISTAAQYNNTIGVGVIPFTNLTFDEVVILNGANPLPAGEIRPIQIQSNVAATGVVLDEGDIEELTDNILYRIDLATSDFDAQLRGLTLSTLGTYEEEDVDRFVLLWSETPGGVRIALDTLSSATAGQLVFDGFNLRLPAGSTRYLWVSVDISSDYAVAEGDPSRTIGMDAIPLSAFDFVYDTDIVNSVGGDPSADLPEGEERTISIRPIVNLTRTSGPTNIINILAPNNHLLYRINAAVTLANARVDSIIVTTSGTYVANDISEFKLFFATDQNVQGTELASVPSVTGFGEDLIFVFSEPQLIEVGQTGYFFIRVDANPLSTVDAAGRTVGIGAVPLNNVKFTAQVERTGADPLAAGNTRAIVSRQDNTTDVLTVETSEQPTGGTISSLSVSSEDEVHVYSFFIFDTGAGDELPTFVTNMSLVPGTSNSVFWDQHIGGISIRLGDDNVSLPIESYIINPSSIDISIESGNLVVEDGEFLELKLYIWLKDGGQLLDNGILSFIVPATHDGSFGSDETLGSIFSTSFTSESIFESNTFTIQVVGTQFEFFDLPALVDAAPETFDLQLRATDIYGNVDLDVQVNPDNFDITFEIGQGDPTLLNEVVWGSGFDENTGVYTATGFEYDENEFITIIANPLGFPSIESDLIQVGDPANLIVRQDLTLSENLIVGGFVLIEPGNTLTLASDVVLTVGGNFTNNGSLVANTGSNIIMQGTGAAIAGNDMTLWNLTISNGASVSNETNITLINTLQVNAGASFDADGSGASNFTLLSNASGTARIGPLLDGAVVNGAVNWQRHIQPGQGWRAIASPINGWSLADISANIRLQGLTDLRPNNDKNIFFYSENLSTTENEGRSGWVAYENLGQSPGIGRGTHVFIFSVDFGGGFARLIKRGTVNQGTTPVSVTQTALAFDGGGWNYLSNPFPSEIDWNAVAATNGTIGAVNIWNPNAGAGGNYGSYVPGNGAGVGGVSRYIASGQSFFVQASEAGDILFQESHKSDQNGQSFVRNRELSDILKMQIRSSGNHRDELAIVFDEESSPGFDRLYDAPKFPGGNIQIYTRSADDRNLSINAPGKLRGAKSFPIYMNPVFFGKYTLSFSELQSFHPSAEIYLIDHLRDEQHLIGEGFTYDFDAIKNNASTFAHGRFELLFAHPVELSLEESYARRNQEVLMPVYARYFEGIHNAELKFGWDESQVEYLGLELSADVKDQIIVSAKKESGTVEVQLTSPVDALPALPDDEALLWLRLSLKPGVQRSEIQLLRNQLRAAGAVNLPVVSANGWLIARNTLALTGAVSTVQGQRINGIRFAIDGPENAEVETNAEGLFETELEDEGIYTIRPLNLDRLTAFSAEPSVADVIALRRHLLSIEKFDSPFAHIAADFNVSGSLSAMDVASLNQHILRTPGHRAADWVMVKESPALAQNPFAFNSEYQFDASTFSEGLLGWRAVQKGIIHMPAAGARNASGEWEVLSKILRYENGTIEVPVMAGVHSGLAGYQFTLSWNPEDYDFVSVQSNVPGLQYNAADAANGQIAVLWTHEQGKGVSFSGQEELFRLVIKGKKEETGDLSLGSAMTSAMAVGEGMQLLEIKHNSLGSYKVFDNAVLFPLYPNPANEYTHIHFSLPEDEEVTLTVYSITGERLHLHKQVYRAGENQYMWNLRGEVGTRVNSGIYIIHLETNGYISSQRLIIE